MAVPAEPILASARWPVLQEASEARKVSTGYTAIDSALHGGLDHGRVACLSASADSGATEIRQALIVSHLLTSEDATVVVIDTSVGLDVRKLHAALTRALREEANASERAVKVLDRLRIMRVFDFVGLMESVSELRDELEGRQPLNESSNANSSPPRGTVGDSEGEDEDDMLDSPSPIRTTAPKERQEHGARGSLLIIDNIAQCMAPLLKNNYVQGQALLSSFMRSLSHETRTHNLCTVLFNGTISTSNAKDESPSVFSSCDIQPALGKSFGYMLDTHLLIHKMPRSTVTAKTDGYRANGDSKTSQVVCVIEVAHDRHGKRVGEWAPFTVDDTGLMKSLA